MKKIYTQPRTETMATTPQQMLCASGGIKAQISGYKAGTSGGFSQTFIWLTCLGMTFLGASCGSNTPDQPKQQAELKPRTLIVTQTDPAHTPMRRICNATITEEDGALNALWSVGDEVSYRNLSREAYSDPTEGSVPLSGTLRADKAENTASFTGDRIWCIEDDQIALVYPKVASFDFHDSPLTGSYTISLAGQDGTLTTLAKSYHHIYGIANVTSVTETTANADLAVMKSLLTVCKFSFVDKDAATETPLAIDKLTIAYGGTGTYNGKYPQTGTVAIAHNTPTANVTVTPATPSEALTIDPGTPSPTEVYVALFPEGGKTTYRFTVTSGSDTYTGEAEATLNEGEFVIATLQLKKHPTD